MERILHLTGFFKSNKYDLSLDCWACLQQPSWPPLWVFFLCNSFRSVSGSAWIPRGIKWDRVQSLLPYFEALEEKGLSDQQGSPSNSFPMPLCSAQVQSGSREPSGANAACNRDHKNLRMACSHPDRQYLCGVSCKSSGQHQVATGRRKNEIELQLLINHSSMNSG